LSEDIAGDRVNEKGQLEMEHTMTDHQFFMENRLHMPDKELRTAYYVLEKDGKVYHVFNAERVPFGRMNTMIADAIRGKNKPTYKRIDPTQGDMAIVVNAEKMLFMGRKLKFKNLKYHTGRVGGLKTKMYKDYIYTKPELIIFNSVYKMLPKNRVRLIHLENLKIYKGKENT
jgi:large subunit ribosomal protein L13